MGVTVTKRERTHKMDSRGVTFKTFVHTTPADISDLTKVCISAKAFALSAGDLKYLTNKQLTVILKGK